MADAYVVAPTSTDFHNAVDYAMQKATKAECDKHPDMYEWVPTTPLPYACPYPLHCDFGRCVFKEAGCKATSQLGYFDCARNSVPCVTNSKGEGTCDVCTFNIQNKFNKQFDVPTIPTDQQCSGEGCASCVPGDLRYYYRTDPEEDKQNDADPVLSKTKCKPVFDPEPYLVDGAAVACKTDMDCAASKGGAGGRCMLYGVPPNTDKRKASGYCVDTGIGYLEYHNNFTRFGTEPPHGQCVRTLPNFRKFCEMPWVRPYMDKVDDLSIPFKDRISKHPDSKLHPPFYYDDGSGKCYVTKQYCSNAVEHGGFETSFGNAYDVGKMFTGCTYPHGKKHSVREGYDCCTPGGQSFGQFFLGKTLLSEMRDVGTGHLSFSEFVHKNPKVLAANVGAVLAPFAVGGFLVFLCDEQLKRDRQLLYPNLAAPGVHAYMFFWSPEARQLYPTLTSDKLTIGLLAQEVGALYPQVVQRDENGYCFIKRDDALSEADPVYRRILNTLTLLAKLQGYGGSHSE